MKEMYEYYKNEISNKKIVLVSIIILCILGLLFGSLYLTILSNDEKKTVLDLVNNYINSYNKINFSSKLDLFKSNLISNLIFFISIWVCGLSILGLFFIFIITFFKSFITGFSISGIFAKYQIKGLLAILIYLIPSSFITLILGLFLASYSSILSIRLVKGSFTKKNINFGSFMGKYFFLLLICILVSIICALFDSFISPYLFKLFIKLTK